MHKPNKDIRKLGSSNSLGLLRPYGGGLALVVGLLFLLTFMDMAAPYLLKLLIDDVFPNASGGENLRLLWIILPGMVFIFLARNMLFYASKMRSLYISEDLCFDLRKRLYEHLQRLNLRFYRRNQPGRLSGRIMDDTFTIQSFIEGKLPTLLRYVLEFQILLIILYVMDWRLAIASTIVLPFHLATSFWFRGPMRKSHSESQESLSLAQGNIVEKFLGMEVVKGFGAEERESRIFRNAINASRQNQIRTQRFQFSQKVVADLLVGLGTVLLLGYGAWNVVTGRMKSGEFLMFFLYVKMLYPAVLEIISGVGHLTKATASVDRVYEMLAEPAGEKAGGGKVMGPLLGKIEYRDVCFRYGQEPTLVLEALNFTIEPGEHVAITGPSGSGKTTLISLLPRFNDPSSGQVLLDGHPLDVLPIDTLRSMYGFVFQEVFLFNTSIYENLRYARVDATLSEMVEACKITGAHDFIQRLPAGYYTHLGAAGGELSRGEKQRITLARALVRNPRVLIVDEATASIDPVAAKEIVRSILEIMVGRTVVMVTHDTELLNLVHRVISIEEGKVTYNGPFRDYPDPSGHLKIERRSSAPAAPEVKGAILPIARAVRSSLASKARRTASALIFALLMLELPFVTSCTDSSVATTQDVQFDRPRAVNGVVLDEDRPGELAKLAAALDAMDFRAALPTAGKASAPESLPQERRGPQGRNSAPARIGRAEALSRVAQPAVPPDATRLVSLPKLSQIEINDIAARLTLRLGADLGYVRASAAVTDLLPLSPEGLSGVRSLTRVGEAGIHALRFGVRRFASQPSQFWVLGVVVTEGSLIVNPDLEVLTLQMAEMLSDLTDMRGSLTVRDLDKKLIQLSYVDTSTALNMLQGLGITTISEPSQVPGKPEFSALPYVVSVPEPDPKDVGLIGTSATTISQQTGLSLMPGMAAEITANAVASPMTQLMVLFHPAHPGQFSEVRGLLDTYIDRPARQIFIEGMVLEISEDGLKDLGIEWGLLDTSPLKLAGGAANAGGALSTLILESDNTSMLHNVFQGDFQWDWSMKIRALIRDKKAEILSRPSVLTLNNRQSTIRVGQDIPIASSLEGFASSSNKVSFQFDYLPTGILLNIRPRISEQGDEVTMLIDTIVSAKVPGEDLEMRDNNGVVLASAPTISTRRVQTYARIRNNTPFIIGGLVSREKTLTQDKIPLLGDLPFVGAAFRTQKEEHEKREVIIVLTPYVLPEKKLIPRSLPKDEDLFDSFGHELFRDSYRIRSDDVFDLTFLLEDERLAAYRALARQVANKNFRLAEDEPFRSLVRDSVPGEAILVTRMIYEVIKRLSLADPVAASRIIYFDSQQLGGYKVEFLEPVLEGMAGGRFKDLGTKALAIVFQANPASLEGDYVGLAPIPTISLVDCLDREAWGTQLWKLNQPTPDGRARQAILIQNQDDLLRLRRALTLKKIVALNGSIDQMRLRNFSVGKVLLMPELTKGQIHVVDAAAASFFFHTEHYYAATLAEIEMRMDHMDDMLLRPEIKGLLDAGPAKDSLGETND